MDPDPDPDITIENPVTSNPAEEDAVEGGQARTEAAEAEVAAPGPTTGPARVDWLPPILGLLPLVPVVVWSAVVFTKSGELVGGVKESDTHVYGLEPHYIITVAAWAGGLAEFSMLAVVLFRVGLHPRCFPVLGGIWSSVEDLIASSSDSSDGEDDTEQELTPKEQRVRAEEISQMSHVLSLLIGPFAIMLVTMSCLIIVMHGLIEDPFGHAINRDFKTTLSASPNDPIGLRDQEFACTSPIGYFGTISGVSANILSEGYVFMFVGITVNAVIVLQNMPTLLVMYGRYKAFDRAEKPGTYSNHWLNVQAFLIRVGFAMTVLTAVLPDFVRGRYSGSEDLSLMHLFGIGVGIMLALVGIGWYCGLALLIYTKHHPALAARPLVWLPHIITVWIFWLTVAMAIGFLAANRNQTGYDTFYNICYLRSPVHTLDHEACELPNTFNRTTYQSFFNSKCCETEYMKLNADGECLDFDPDALVYGRKGQDNYLTACAAFEAQKCTLSMDGVQCVNTDCHFREYSVSFAFEAALIFLGIVEVQLFIICFHCDWKIHSKLIVVERNAASPTSASLETRKSKNKKLRNTVRHATSVPALD